MDSINQRSLICPQERDYLQRVHLPQSLADTDRLYLRDLKGHFGCVNSLSFSSGMQEYLASGIMIGNGLCSVWDKALGNCTEWYFANSMGW